MNVVEVRSRLRRLSVPRRSVEREGDDRRQGDRRQAVADTQDMADDLDTTQKYVRISVTPGEKTLLQDMYLLDDE